MKNLENYGVANINTQEMREVDGGIPLDYNKASGYEAMEAAR